MDTYLIELTGILTVPLQATVRQNSRQNDLEGAKKKRKKSWIKNLTDSEMTKDKKKKRQDRNEVSNASIEECGGLGGGIVLHLDQTAQFSDPTIYRQTIHTKKKYCKRSRTSISSRLVYPPLSLSLLLRTGSNRSIEMGEREKKKKRPKRSGI